MCPKQASKNHTHFFCLAFVSTWEFFIPTDFSPLHSLLFYVLQSTVIFTILFTVCDVFLFHALTLYRMCYINKVEQSRICQRHNLQTRRLKRVLHILSPAEDAGEQRRSFSVVLLERRDMDAPSWKRRAGRTLDSLPGAFWRVHGTQGAQHICGRQEETSGRRREDKQKQNGVVLTL